MQQQVRHIHVLIFQTGHLAAYLVSFEFRLLSIIQLSNEYLIYVRQKWFTKTAFKNGSDLNTKFSFDAQSYIKDVFFKMEAGFLLISLCLDMVVANKSASLCLQQGQQLIISLSGDQIR